MTHQAHGSSIVRARLTGEVEFHTMFDIKSLPSTSWLGWVEKTLEDQRRGSWHGKVLNTLCLRLKHGLAASAWAQRCTEGIGAVCDNSHVPVPPQNQHLVLASVPALSLQSACSLCLPSGFLGLHHPPLISCVPSPSAVSQDCLTCCWARRSTCCSAGHPSLASWPEDGSCLKTVRGVTFGSSQASEINKLFELSTDGTEKSSLQ